MASSGAGVLGAGAVLGGFVIMGEGLAVGIVAGFVGLLVIIGMAVGMLVYVATHPLKSLRAWGIFIGGGTAMVALPFAIMELFVLQGRSEVDPNFFQCIVSLCCFGILVVALGSLPGYYEYCEEL